MIKPALAADYAAMLNAALSLYEATSKKHYLDSCETWLSKLDEDYSDGNGGFYLTSKTATDLLVRPRADQDEANPSASSLILEAMVRYANLSGNIGFHEKAQTLVKNQEAIARANKYGMAGYMNALDSYFHHVHFLVCGVTSESKDKLLKTVRNLPMIAKTISIQDDDMEATHNGIALPKFGEKPCIIACSRQTCSASLHTKEELYEYLKI